MDEKQTRKNLEIPKIDPEESVVKISGFFNQKNMEDLERAFSTVDQASSRHLTIDCENLVHIDTPNIALLVGKHNEYKAQGRVLTLRSVPSSIIKILKLSRLDALLNIESEKPTVEGEERDDSIATDERGPDPTSDDQDEQVQRISQAESRSNFAEELARSLLENVSDMVLIFDPECGRLLVGNPSLLELLGGIDPEIETISVYDLCHELAGEGKPWEDGSATIRYPTKSIDQTWQFADNLRRELKVTYIPIDYPSEGAILAVCKDVTPEWNLEIENRNLQRQLKGTLRDLSFLEKRARDFNRLLEREPLCFSLLDGAMEVVPEAEAGVILLFNSTLNRLKAQATIGFPRPDRIAEISLKQGEGLPGVSSEILWRHLTMEGEGSLSSEAMTIWEESIRPKAVRSTLVHPLVSQQAQVGFLILVSFDDPRAFRRHDEDLLDSLTLAGATALEKSFLVERIRHSEIHLRSILESVPVSIFSVDENGHVDTWNDASEQLFGWSAGDAVGKHISNFYPLDDCPDAEGFLKSLKSLDDWSGEIDIRTKSGESVITRQILHPYPNTEGTKRGLVFVVEDIRKMVELRDQLMRAQKLESVGVLAGGIAHDFNNLIGAILGYSSFLRSQLADEDKNTRYAEVIESTAEQASQLTRKLLDFAKGSTEQKVLAGIRQVLEDCYELVHPSMPVGVKFEVSLPEESMEVWMAPTAIQQVVLNLCLNARDVLGEDGQIALRVDRAKEVPSQTVVNASGDSSANWIVLEVEDNGPGVDDSIRDEIFKPFFTTKSVGKGSGLGLAMVCRVIVDHGGWLQLDSRKGRGSIFRVGLPLGATSREDSGAEGASNESRQNQLILVVDDEPLVRELATTVLESTGYQVVSAADGEAALDKFKADPDSFSLAIVDVLMPVMGGEELVQEIAKIRPDFPILLSSGYAPKSSLDEKIKKKEIEFLPKPYRSRQLLEKVEQMLNTSQ